MPFKLKFMCSDTDIESLVPPKIS